ncbi:MAG: hypothetical protein ACRD9Q_02215 [Nitrososphaeraceae archaeon]
MIHRSQILNQLMPEWNIQRIEKFDSSRVTSIEGMYYLHPHDETFDLFVLNDKKIRCSIARELNYDGKVLATIGEDAIFTGKVIDYYEKTYHTRFNALVIPDSFSKKFGIRQGNYLDFTIESIVKANNEIPEEVFPKKRANGMIAIKPSNERIIPTSRISDTLLEFSIKDEFFNNLIQAINDSYAYELYRATHVLLRTLFENLILRLLRTRFSNDQIDLWYDSEKRKIKDFSLLIKNLKDVKHEFPLHAKSFDEKFFTFLDTFREKSNANAHTLEVYLNKESLDKEKEYMNYCIKLLNAVIDDSKNSPAS